MFSKTIDRWLGDAFGVNLNKPPTMERAATDVAVDKINVESLRRLLGEIRRALNGTRSEAVALGEDGSHESAAEQLPTV